MNNKLFVKNHLFLNYKRTNENINKINRGQFAIYFLEGGLLFNSEFQAFKFFLKKNLKFFSKLYIRLKPFFKNTKKPIGIRMGKGKGNLNIDYTPVSRGQIFIEFGFSKHLSSLSGIKRKRLLLLIRRIVKVASLKLKKKTKLIFNKEQWF